MAKTATESTGILACRCKWYLVLVNRKQVASATHLWRFGHRSMPFYYKMKAYMHSTPPIVSTHIIGCFLFCFTPLFSLFLSTLLLWLCVCLSLCACSSIQLSVLLLSSYHASLLLVSFYYFVGIGSHLAMFLYTYYHWCWVFLYDTDQFILLRCHFPQNAVISKTRTILNIQVQTWKPVDFDVFNPIFSF